MATRMRRHSPRRCRELRILGFLTEAPPPISCLAVVEWRSLPTEPRSPSGSAATAAVLVPPLWPGNWACVSAAVRGERAPLGAVFCDLAVRPTSPAWRGEEDEEAKASSGVSVFPGRLGARAGPGWGLTPGAVGGGTGVRGARAAPGSRRGSSEEPWIRRPGIRPGPRPARAPALGPAALCICHARPHLSGAPSAGLLRWGRGEGSVLLSIKPGAGVRRPGLCHPASSRCRTKRLLRLLPMCLLPPPGRGTEAAFVIWVLADLPLPPKKAGGGGEVGVPACRGTLPFASTEPGQKKQTEQRS